MASRFSIASRRHTVTMLWHALRVRRALLATPGALGVSLVAHPMRGEYWTLSGWTDRQALDGFVRSPVHRAAMRTLGPAMADSTFVFWAHDAAAEPPTWTEATARVDADRALPPPAPDSTA
jgi:quinol monooxygenase YgiN